jgi:hypothetical protein
MDCLGRKQSIHLQDNRSFDRARISGIRASSFDTPGVLPQGVAGVCNVVTGVPDKVD